METYRLLGTVFALTTLLALGGVISSCGQGGIEPQATAPEAEEAPAGLGIEGGVVAGAALPIVTLPGESLEGNLLVNPGFEETTDGALVAWTVKTSATPAFTLDKGTTAEGAQSVELKSSEPVSLWQELGRPGQYRYVAQCLALLPESAGDLTVGLRAVGEHRAGDGEAVSVPAPTDAGNQWVVLQVELETSPLAEGVVMIVDYQGGASDAVVLIDDCRLHALASPPGQNLIRNGDFTAGHLGLGSWRVPDGVECRVVDLDGPGALDKALEVTLGAQQNIGIQQSVGGLRAGTPYVFRACVKTQDAAGMVCLEIQHGTKGFREFMARSEILTGTHDWTWLSCEFTPPVGMTTGNFFLRRPTAGDTPGMAWFADIEVFEEP